MFFDAGGRGKSMSKRRTPQERARIVPEFLNTCISAAGLCLRHNISPATFQNWEDEFMEGGKQVLGIRQEFIWKHTPEQNGHMESFHGTPKRKHAWPREFAKFQDAGAVLARALADYNNDRIFSAPEYVTPNESACEAEGGNKWGSKSFGEGCKKRY